MRNTIFDFFSLNISDRLNFSHELLQTAGTATGTTTGPARNKGSQELPSVFARRLTRPVLDPARKWWTISRSSDPYGHRRDVVD